MGVFNNNESLAQKALQWVLTFNEVSCVIPGASSVKQILSNIETIKARPISDIEMEKIVQGKNETPNHDIISII